MDLRDLCERFAAFVFPQFEAYWTANADVLVDGAILDEEARAIWRADPPTPQLANDLVVLAKPDLAGDTLFWTFTVGEHCFVYVRLEASGRLSNGVFADVVISSHDADAGQAAPINGGVDRIQALQADGYVVVVDPAEDDE